MLFAIFTTFATFHREEGYLQAKMEYEKLSHEKFIPMPYGMSKGPCPTSPHKVWCELNTFTHSPHIAHSNRFV